MITFRRIIDATGPATAGSGQANRGPTASADPRQQAILDKVGPAAAQAAANLTGPATDAGVSARAVPGAHAGRGGRAGAGHPVRRAAGGLRRHRRPAESVSARQPATACEQAAETKYFMDAAPVTGADLATAQASSGPGDFWKVDPPFAAVPRTNSGARNPNCCYGPAEPRRQA